MSVCWQMTEGLGFPQFNAAVTGVCTVIGILLMIILSANFGNYGVAVARLAGFTAIFFSIFIAEKIFFKAVQLRLWARLTVSLGCAAIAAAVIEHVAASLMPINWLTFIVSIAVGGLTYCLILWFVGFLTADEKLLMKQIVGR